MDNRTVHSAGAGPASLVAAQSIITGKSYDNLWHGKLRSAMKTSLVYRWLFAHLGNYGYERFLDRLSPLDDIIGELGRHYRLSWHKLMLFQLARHWHHTHLIDRQCSHQHCDRVWCRNGQNARGHRGGRIFAAKPQETT